MDKDFIFLQQWMFDLFEPKEKGRGTSIDYIKVLIFAYVYSYSRDGKSCWYGKQQTLANLVHASEQTVCNKLKELVNDGFIICEKIDCYGMFHHNNYRINPIYLELTVVNSEITMVNSELTNNKSLYINNNTNIELQPSAEPHGVLTNETPLRGDKEGLIYKPSAQQVKGYAIAKGLAKNPKFELIDWDEFIDYYEKLDWVDINGKPIDWRRKVRYWIENHKEGFSKNQPDKRAKLNRKHTSDSKSGAKDKSSFSYEF